MKKSKLKKTGIIGRGVLTFTLILILTLLVAADQSEFVQIIGDTMTGDLTVLGNIGLGTTSPQVKLEISEPGYNYLRMSTEASNDYYSQLEFADSGGVEGYLRYSYYEHYLKFMVNNSERLRIDSDGYVGIGTTAPQAQLHVIGDLQVDGNIAAKYQ